MRRTFTRATIKVSADFSDLKEGLEAIKKQREIEESLAEELEEANGEGEEEV